MRDDTKFRARRRVRLNKREREEEEEGCKCEHTTKTIDFLLFFTRQKVEQKKEKRRHPLMWWWWMRTTKAFVLSLSLLNVFHIWWIIKKWNELTRRLSRFPLSRARWSIPRTSRVHSRIQSPRNPPTRSRRNSKRNTAFFLLFFGFFYFCDFERLKQTSLLSLSLSISRFASLSMERWN